MWHSQNLVVPHLVKKPFEIKERVFKICGTRHNVADNEKGQPSLLFSIQS
jgi:hypothetical protein